MSSFSTHTVTRQTRRAKRQELKVANTVRQANVESEAEGIHDRWIHWITLDEQAKTKPSNASKRDKAWSAFYDFVHFALDDCPNPRARFASKEDSKGCAYFELVKGTGRYFRITDADLPQELPSEEQRERLGVYSISNKKQETSDNNEQNDLAFEWRHYTNFLLKGEDDEAQSVLKNIVDFGDRLPPSRHFRVIKHNGINLVEYLRNSNIFLGMKGANAVEYALPPNHPMFVDHQSSISHRSARIHGVDRAEWIREHK